MIHRFAGRTSLKPKKNDILPTLSVTSFAALGSRLAGLLTLTPQAETYGKPVSQVSYGVGLVSRGSL